MKHRLLLLGSLLLLAGMLAACGGSPTNTMPGMNMRTAVPSTKPGAGTAGRPIVTVHVTETEFKIASSLITFIPGTKYHFVVKNVGKTAHEFMVMPRDEGAMPGMSMENMDREALARIETIAPGETQALDYTFPSSSAGSRPEFACYLPGHYEAGMKLGVAVSA